LVDELAGPRAADVGFVDAVGTGGCLRNTAAKALHDFGKDDFGKDDFGKDDFGKDFDKKIPASATGPTAVAC
jgi:hypothetical protein